MCIVAEHCNSLENSEAGSKFYMKKILVAIFFIQKLWFFEHCFAFTALRVHASSHQHPGRFLLTNCNILNVQCPSTWGWFHEGVSLAGS